MKTDDILSLILTFKDKTTELKSIMDDFQELADHLSKVAVIGKSMIEKFEKIKK